MTVQSRESIAFDVETGRILQILSSEIYDSPKAFLRENVQNAYDAVLMRCTAQGLPIADRRIDVIIENEQLTVRDDGIGMTEEVLRENFWKAGSSGKKSALAQQSGVIGTFGIGAMANFGVCSALRIETRHVDSNITLISSAKREDLRISQNCIELERTADNREPGTIVISKLDPSLEIDEASARGYLSQYVRFLPVPVFVNGHLISQQAFESALGDAVSGFDQISSKTWSSMPDRQWSARFKTFVNPQARVLVRIDDIKLNGKVLSGEAFFMQRGGQTFGYRSLFGLAPIPISGMYSLGGFVNLDILHPTAGREALSRESIELVNGLVSLTEGVISNELAETPAADRNQDFQQYILWTGRIVQAKNVKITVLPAREEVPLGEIKDYAPSKPKHFYAGHDSTILQRFASEQANLLHVAQTNPRRNLQLRFLKEELDVKEVPEKTIVDRIPSAELTRDEVAFLIHLRDVLLTDYFMPDIDAAFATISHGVTIQVVPTATALQISIARNMPSARVVVESYRSAREAFHPFVKDFVREHLYERIRDHVPSSTRQGRDALYRRLKENEELYRVDKSEYGEAESLLDDFLSGKAELGQVLRKVSTGRTSGQYQVVFKEQVGTVEHEFPDIIESPSQPDIHRNYEATPPILRPEVTSSMKVLTVSAERAKLNGFQMFLALSDRLALTEGEFLRTPHTTKIMWGSHRVIYVFGNATGDLSLYYDIKLKEPLEAMTTGGAMLPTTTIVTKSRMYIPVPKVLESAFQITDATKEFFVRFDTIP